MYGNTVQPYIELPNKAKELLGDDTQNIWFSSNIAVIAENVAQRQAALNRMI